MRVKRVILEGRIYSNNPSPSPGTLHGMVMDRQVLSCLQHPVPTRGPVRAAHRNASALLSTHSSSQMLLSSASPGPSRSSAPRPSLQGALHRLECPMYGAAFLSQLWAPSEFPNNASLPHNFDILPTSPLLDVALALCLCRGLLWDLLQPSASGMLVS